MANPNFVPGTNPYADAFAEGFGQLAGGLGAWAHGQMQDNADVSDAQQAWADHLQEILNSGHPQAAQAAAAIMDHPEAQQAWMDGAPGNHVADIIHAKNYLAQQGQQNDPGASLDQGIQTQRENPEAVMQGAQAFTQRANGLTPPLSPSLPDGAAGTGQRMGGVSMALTPQAAAPQRSGGLHLGRLSNKDYATIIPKMEQMAAARMGQGDRTALENLRNESAYQRALLTQQGLNRRADNAQETKKEQGAANRQTRKEIAADKIGATEKIEGRKDQTRRDLAAARIAADRAKQEAKNAAKAGKSPQEQLTALLKIKASIAKDPTIIGNPEGQAAIKEIDGYIQKVQSDAASGRKPVKIEGNAQTGQKRITYNDGSVEVQ